MNRVRHLRMYDLHSWTGLAIGLLIYIVTFTGCVALIYGELEPWEDPAKRIALPSTPIGIHEPFTKWVDTNLAPIADGEAEVEFLMLIYPSQHRPYYSGYMHGGPKGGEHADYSVRWHPVTGEPLPERGDGLTEWILGFHTDLMWPAALGGKVAGEALVGVVGIALLLSIISGVIIHMKIKEEIFTLRYLRSVRLKWQDTHKILGLWLLPFYTMISFTGAVLGLIALLAPIIAVLAFKGDQEALIEAVLGSPAEPAGIVAPMTSLDMIGAHHRTGQPPARVSIKNWGDEAAEYDVMYPAKTELAIFDTVTLSGVTGDIIKDSSVNTLSAATRTSSTLSPLHFGTFGGIWLKGFYFVLGLSLAAVTATGIMMWTERRLNGNVGARTTSFYRRLSRLSVGIMMGLPVASASIFYLDKLYIGSEGARLAWTGWTYFIAWGACTAYALRRPNEYQTVRQLMALVGGLMVGLPFVNMLATGDVFLGDLAAGTGWAWADFLFILVGALTIYVSRTLPAKRPEKKKKRRSITTTDTSKAAPQPHTAPAE
ncbi:MAG: PepSY-associated TM helix domain-containing protein [Pseudomonadota bacterium]